jgi:PAS domain S-box-containing protein
VITRDITEYRNLKEERQRLSKQVKELERTFNGILSASDDRVYVFDKDMRYTYVNPPGARELGVKPKDIVGKTWKEINIPLEPMQHVIALADTVFATGRPQTGELQWDRADGTAQCYEYVHAPIFNSRGEVTSIATTFRNITERKRAEKELQQAHDELEQKVQERTSELQDDIEERKVTEEELQRTTGELLDNVESSDVLNASYKRTPKGWRSSERSFGQAMRRHLSPRSRHYLLTVPSTS